MLHDSHVFDGVHSSIIEAGLDIFHVVIHQATQEELSAAEHHAPEHERVCGCDFMSEVAHVKMGKIQ